MDRGGVAGPMGALGLVLLSSLAGRSSGLLAPSLEDPSWAPRAPVLAALPRRVVSATVATDEILLALLPPERIAALTVLADDPRISSVTKEARSVRGRVDADAERILELDPDLVFVARYTERAPLMLLESAGVPIVRLPFCSRLADVREAVLLVGRSVGEPEKAQALVREMDARIAAVAARTADAPRPRVLFYTPGGYTAGKGTLFDEMLAAAGGINAAVEAGVEGPGNLSLERMLELDPDVLLVSDYIGDPKARGAAPERGLLKDPVWREASAVKSGRVRLLSERHLTCVSQHLGEAAEAMGRALHPELFP